MRHTFSYVGKIAHFITIDNIDARTIVYVFSCLLYERYLYLFFYSLLRIMLYIYIYICLLFVVRAISVFIFYFFFLSFLFAINKYLVIYDSYNQSRISRLSNYRRI